MRLHGKVCIVTGGGSGIGAATCKVFAREGAAVVVADKSLDAAKAVAGAIGDQAIALEVDVAQSDKIAKMVRDAVARFGRVDVVGQQRRLRDCRGRGANR